MTSYYEVYEDARRKLTPWDSLNYTISDVKNNHPAMRHYYSKDTMAIINSLVESACRLERCITDLYHFSHRRVLEHSIEQKNECIKHLCFYLGEDVIAQFIQDRNNELETN